MDVKLFSNNKYYIIFIAINTLGIIPNVVIVIITFILTSLFIGLSHIQR